MDFTDYDFTMNQFDVARDITSGTTTLDEYLEGFTEQRDIYSDDKEYLKHLDELYKEAKRFADKAEEKWYELDNILVANNYGEFYPIGKSDIFEFVD